MLYLLNVCSSLYLYIHLTFYVLYNFFKITIQCQIKRCLRKRQIINNLIIYVIILFIRLLIFISTNYVKDRNQKQSQRDDGGELALSACVAAYVAFISPLKATLLITMILQY